MSPTNTGELADKLALLAQSDAYELYHIAAEDNCTWFELADEIYRQEGLTVDLRPTTSRAFGARAQRPNMSALRSIRLATIGVSPWRPMLHDHLEGRRR